MVKPRKVFLYQSIWKALQSLVQRSGFCNAVRNGGLGGIFEYLDTLVWEEYKELLNAPYNYLLTLNVDWFWPFEHGRYSVGGIYLSIQSLPASIRNHPDNIILVDIIPGPSEPHLTLNIYLSPLTTELLSAWNEGFSLSVSRPNEQSMQTIIRVVLMCVACDIPATRKVCRFLGHRATLGCNKWLKAFQQMQESGSLWTNYAGFERSEWVMRTDENHRQSCKEIMVHFQTHGTKTVHEQAESQRGLRYSVLLELQILQSYTLPCA